MRVSYERLPRPRSRGESGGARLNFLFVIAFIALVGYAVYQYAPVAYNAFKFKDYMQETVNRAVYPPGQTVEWVESQLRAAGREYDLPPETKINVQNVEGQIVARVQWMRPVEMPGFLYEYQFDHTAKSSGFINPK
ncbi:MAG: hypothetical protein LC802_15945 [Acidobacteria bacterium]|nr:hypothetical protein [Acidobacteriota bacterium]